MGFIVSEKLNQEQAIDTMYGILKWFKNNPKRKICRTTCWSVRKNHIIEDVLSHTRI